MASTYWERSVIEELQAIRAAIEAVAEALRPKESQVVVGLGGPMPSTSTAKRRSG